MPQEASCDELNAPFSEASWGTVRHLFTDLDIQGREVRQDDPVAKAVRPWTLPCFPRITRMNANGLT
jgi:hypothetical protein